MNWCVYTVNSFPGHRRTGVSLSFVRVVGTVRSSGRETSVGHRVRRDDPRGRAVGIRRARCGRTVRIYGLLTVRVRQRDGARYGRAVRVRACGDRTVRIWRRGGHARVRIRASGDRAVRVGGARNGGTGVRVGARNGGAGGRVRAWGGRAVIRVRARGRMVRVVDVPDIGFVRGRVRRFSHRLVVRRHRGFRRQIRGRVLRRFGGVQVLCGRVAGVGGRSHCHQQ